MELRKNLTLSDVALSVDAAAGTFSGYASKFNGVDSYGDTILPGAFKKTLKAMMPKIFVEHAWGGLPVGKPLKAEEDDVGLLVTVEMTPGMTAASEAYAALKHGTVDGLSVGGAISKDSYKETETGRVIKTWDVLREISIVCFPADPKARVMAVKAEDFAAAIKGIETVREFESFLRDAGGYTKSAAQELTAKAKALFTARDAGVSDAEKSVQKLAERIARLAA
jgi:HK97 family phage prohead protease